MTEPTAEPTANEPATASAPAVPIPDSIEEICGQYVKLRDKIKEHDDVHKDRMATAKNYLKTLEGALLAKLNAIGGESVKTASGTVYRTTRRSATIKDAEAFRNYVTESGAFDLVDLRANANAVDDFIKSYNDTPPGVDFSVAYTVGVRRA